MRVDGLMVVLTVLCTLIIFGFSLTPAEVSISHTRQLERKVENVLKPQTKNHLNIFNTIRKTAHILEFFLLGIITALYFMIRFSRFNGSLGGFVSGEGRSRFVFLLSYGLLVALVDEAIQVFNPGRNSSLYDVMIDLGGYFSGIMVVALVFYLFNLDNCKL